ncbi:hypothetical protein [Paremcibacter congregatus]|uniref:Sel1 repeat family protein n=1 Tax=Paremcibacter congregatus TaxID=2043170 RepID=A0A2G4YRU8_9PROT|nr:hypothetical protein [Paremcibacter congregatus]PHZ85084.1 hypothetical protein CRD36_08560 [Paremcibacter congregatus]QDE27966.1 hypothetical protein FIV45_12135 [Paremcibacter congregatus]
MRSIKNNKTRLGPLLIVLSIFFSGNSAFAKENLNCLFSEQAKFVEACKAVRADFLELTQNSRGLSKESKHEKLEKLFRDLKQIEDYGSIEAYLVLISQSAYYLEQYDVAESKAIEALSYKHRSSNPDATHMGWAILTGVYAAQGKILSSQEALKNAKKGLTCADKPHICAYVLKEKGVLEIAMQNYGAANSDFDKAASMFWKKADSYKAGLIYYTAAEFLVTRSAENAIINYMKAKDLYCSMEQERVCELYSSMIDVKVRRLKENKGK